jgi:hypothetical protein
LIEDKDLLDQYRAWLKNRRQGENPLTARLKTQKANVKVARFVVDTLIEQFGRRINGVFMAKAIVGGQSIDALEQIWSIQK